jgi:hypothetical protein
METITITRRATTPFLQSIPPQIEHFDAYIYAVVPRKSGLDIPEEKFGKDVRIDPCVLDWKQKAITATIPLDINTGITSADDLDDTWLEAVEAGFLALIYGCLP